MHVYRCSEHKCYSCERWLKIQTYTTEYASNKYVTLKIWFFWSIPWHGDVIVLTLVNMNTFTVPNNTQTMCNKNGCYCLNKHLSHQSRLKWHNLSVRQAFWCCFIVELTCCLLPAEGAHNVPSSTCSFFRAIIIATLSYWLQPHTSVLPHALPILFLLSAITQTFTGMLKHTFLTCCYASCLMTTDAYCSWKKKTVLHLQPLCPLAPHHPFSWSPWRFIYYYINTLHIYIYWL